jgi:hypothetical protein
MSNFEGGSQNPGGSGSAGDPIGAFAAALRDSWALGMSVVEKVLGQGAEEVGFGDFGASTGDAGKPAEIVSAIAQSYLIAAGSGLRYLSRVAQTCAAHQTDILSSVVGSGVGREASEEDSRAITENVREYLRELGDIAQQEARILQVELEKVGEGLARAADEGGTPSPHQRHWKVKS